MGEVGREWERCCTHVLGEGEFIDLSITDDVAFCEGGEAYRGGNRKEKGKRIRSERERER